MPANRNALLRYRAIDACLTNRYRTWTLDALIEKVTEALAEAEGISRISRRTIQADLQLMRSDKLGYNAPIVVVNKNQYTYADPDYSITRSPLTGQDLNRISEAVSVLKQFSGFSHFQELAGVVQKLEAHVYSAQHEQQAVIDFEHNQELRGLAFLEPLYRAVVQQQAVQMTYQSFRAQVPQEFVFHIWWLKEFRNRWFAVGVRDQRPDIQHLALDRMLDVAPAPDLDYRTNPGHRPDTFYRDAIGVTVSPTLRPLSVQIRFPPEQAPYVETKPLHPSQTILARDPDGGMIIGLRVQHNYELERDLLAFGDGLEVLSPSSLRNRIARRLQKAVRQYGE